MNAASAFDATCIPAQARTCEYAQEDMCDSAMPNVAEERNSNCRNTEFQCAKICAQPFKAKTLVVHGAVTPPGGSVATAELAQEDGKARVLLDTGSENSFVRTDLASDMPETGKHYELKFAKEGALNSVPEVRMQLSIGDCTALVITQEWTALKLPLPAGIDVILGMDWMVPYDASLLTSQQHVNFRRPGTNDAFVVKVPDRLQHDIFNAESMLCTSSQCSKAQEVYL